MSLQLSVVIPVYNPGPELIDALASIRVDPERSVVILVDDGSSPPVQTEGLSPELNILLIRLDENQGVATALNVGVRESIRAGAKYIARFDGDDVCLPDRFDRQIEILEANEQLAMVASRVFYMSADSGAIIGESPRISKVAAKRGLYIDNTLPHPTWMLRRQTFEKYGLYDERLDLVEDYEFLRRVLEVEDFELISTPLVKYRIHNRSVSRSRRGRQLRNLLAVQIKYMTFSNAWSLVGVARTAMYLAAYPTALALTKWFSGFRERDLRASR